MTILVSVVLLTVACAYSYNRGYKTGFTHEREYPKSVKGAQQYFDVYFNNDSIFVGVTVMWHEDKIRIVSGLKNNLDTSYLDRNNSYIKAEWYNQQSGREAGE